jgi:hypothetical protein
MKEEEAWKKEDDVRKKAEEEAQKKTMVVGWRSDEGQSFKNVRTWRK